jgi:molybdenum cofactor guanylyltransferase
MPSAVPKMPFMAPPHSDLTAFILAGGRSSRMGRDKAFLEFEGQSLLRRALLLAHSVARDVRIVGPASKFSASGIVVEDTFPDRGPLGGIHTALNASPTDLNLILAVDMPFLSKRFLIYLVQRARTNDAIITIPRTQSGWEPLCAIYRRSFATIAEAALKSGENKIDRLFQNLKLNPITEEDLQPFPQNQFRNLNTPEDLSKSKSQIPNPKSQILNS